MLLDILLFFKKKNFTRTREVDIGNGVVLTEYVYNMRKYFTDVWPPKMAGRDFPIRHAIREDGLDITTNILSFAGPMKNYINPIGAYTRRKKLSIEFVNAGFRITFKEVWEPYRGVFVVTNTAGIKKVIHCNQNNEGTLST